MADRDDYCERCGARLGDCTCAARWELDDALDEMLGRGAPARTTATDEVRDRARQLATRVADAIRDHVERLPKCPHCAKCPRLFSNLLTAQRACEDILGALDMLERLSEAPWDTDDSRASALLTAASRRCEVTLDTLAAQMDALLHSDGAPPDSQSLAEV